jgi:kynurenine formamidase
MPENWREVANRVRNWGKWGDSDQIGTLNYITPEKIVAASRLVKWGRSFPLCAPFAADGPWSGSFFRRNPIRLMVVHGGDEQIADHLEGFGGSVGETFKTLYQGPMRFVDDVIVMNLQCGTQWDALSHVWYEHQLYNGYPASAVTGLGTTKNGIDKVAERGQIVTRGVLLDVARKSGLPHLINTIVTPEKLEATSKAENLAIEQGDVVLVRTGWWGRFVETRDGGAFLRGSPGLSRRCAEWLHDKKVAAVTVDNVAVEVSPAEIEDTPPVAAHADITRDGIDAGRDLGAGRTRRRLRSGQDLRIHVGRTAAVDSGCRRLTGRAAGDQMRASFDAKIPWWEGCPWT